MRGYPADEWLGRTNLEYGEDGLRNRAECGRRRWLLRGVGQLEQEGDSESVYKCLLCSFVAKLNL